ncbi:MAG: hypothetical protein ACRDP1_04330 [Nocardioidaceae bacterium]
MTSVLPRAAGLRLPYQQLPAHVRRWVESALGAPVVQATTQAGGMSPGCAARLVLADGRRAFVKAVGDALNPVTPSLFRHEIEVLSHLGRVEYRPAVLDSYDDGRWVGLLFEDVEGTYPDLRLDSVADAVWEAVATQSRELTPAPTGLDIPTLVDQADRWNELGWVPLMSNPGAYLPAALAGKADQLAERVGAVGNRVDVSSLCNWDIRNDNLLQRPDGSIVIVDWGMARLGPGWGDLLALSLEWAETPVFDDRMAAVVDADPAVVTDLLLGLGGMLAYRATLPAPVGLPSLNEFRRTESARFLAAATRRLEAGL